MNDVAKTQRPLVVSVHGVATLSCSIHDWRQASRIPLLGTWVAVWWLRLHRSSTGHTSNNDNYTDAGNPQAQPQPSNARAKKKTKAAPSTKSLSALKPDKDKMLPQARRVDSTELGSDLRISCFSVKNTAGSKQSEDFSYKGKP